jgi:hypothetical protein
LLSYLGASPPLDGRVRPLSTLHFVHLLGAVAFVRERLSLVVGALSRVRHALALVRAPFPLVRQALAPLRGRLAGVQLLVPPLARRGQLLAP